MTTVFIILVLATGYSAIKIVGEIISSRNCPDDKMLKKVVLGVIDRNSKKARSITKHLGICEDCRYKVDLIMKDEL